MKKHWAVVVPMANEEADFEPFITALKSQLNDIGNGEVFLVVDTVSKDRTRELCDQLAKDDPRFHSVWAPENKNVVDAYLRGYREAIEKSDAQFIIEMDAGMSHDPAELRHFLSLLKAGYECVYGSRFIPGGSMGDSPAKRQTLSKVGTKLSNNLLGTRLFDMTSGYQGFHRSVVEKFLAYKLHSKAHFYQTEIRYLLRKHKSIEVPIHYKAPSPRVSRNAIRNSLTTLTYYFLRRLTLRPVSL